MQGDQDQEPQGFLTWSRETNNNGEHHATELEEVGLAASKAAHDSLLNPCPGQKNCKHLHNIIIIVFSATLPAGHLAQHHICLQVSFALLLPDGLPL
jgi:hypothetical protein